MGTIYCYIALFMWAVSLLFSKEYFAHYSHKARYYSFMLITMFATLGVFLSKDLFTLFIFFEIMSLSSYVWVVQEETEEALKAGVTYLAIAVIGGMVMLMGLFLFNHAVGTLKIEEIYGAVQNVWAEKSAQIYTAGFFMLFGFGAKAGMFPLHFWLPKAHPVAPAPASALLSGILTKCGIFGILILTAQVFAHDLTWGGVILTLGVFGMVLGAVLAVFSVNLKRTLACSSVSQIGFILIGIGMQCFLGEENAYAVEGTFLHMVNHSLIKLLLFNLAGAVYMNTHALDLNTVRGFGRKKPFLMAAFLMGALGIGGMPLWNGYVSKTLLHEAIVEYIVHLTNHGHSAVIFQIIEWAFLFSGGLTVAYMMKLFVCLFVEKNPKHQDKYDAKTSYMSMLSKVVLGIPAVILPVMGIALGRHHFTWAHLKGGLISIEIGVAVYFFVIRKVFMKHGEYVNLWPEKLDLESLFAKMIWGCIHFLGFVSKIPDGFLSEWCTVENLLKGLNLAAKIPERLPEGIVGFLKGRIYQETTEGPERKFTNKLHALYDRKVDTLRLIGSSLSFGLLLACVGLILTIMYLMMH